MRLTRAALAVLPSLVVPVLLAGTPSAAAVTTHAIAISDYAFMPAAMTITAGDTVTWTNADQAPHDVTTTSGPVSIHGSTMSTGQSWSYTFTTPGTYSYICSIHPDMRATLTVRAAPTSRAAQPTARLTTVVPRAVPPPQHRHPIDAPPSRAMATHPRRVTPVASTSSVPVQAAASTNPPARSLRPLLIVAGAVAAVATLALLMLAARPESVPEPDR